MAHTGLPPDLAGRSVNPTAPPVPADNTFPTPTGEGTPQQTMAPPSAGEVYDPALQPLVDQAVAALSERLGIDPSAVQVLSAKAIVWPDSSYGCPQPGMEYLQVPQDGARIRLRAAGEEYSYHSGSPQGLFLCEQVITLKLTSPALDRFLPTPGEDY